MATTYPRDDSSFIHYTRMARYYDTIYSKILDYSSQADYLERIIAKHKDQKRPGSILDVACGTGNYTFIFAERGWKATGIDISNEMIRIATEKATKKTNPRFVRMDMRKIELQEKYDVATVLFGGFGYLLEHEEVENFLAGVEKRLGPRALLIFDFWQNSAIFPAASRPSGHTSWDRSEDDDRLIIRLHTSKYNAQSNILNVQFDFYILDTKGKKPVDNFSETHQTKTYAISHIQELLERNKLKALAFYDGDIGKSKKDEPKDASFGTFRVLAVATPTSR